MQYVWSLLCLSFFNRELNKEKSLPRGKKILQIDHNQVARTYFLEMYRAGVKEVNVNAFKCVNLSHSVV